jgi:hypothetical protein
MAARKRQVDADGNAFEFGSKVRLERGLATAPDAVHRWYVYRKIDTKADKDTLLDEMWDEVASYGETEPGVMPKQALERAQALAEKE